MADRRCFVLREVEIKMENLVKGDVFRLEPASEKDTVYRGWNLAEEDVVLGGENQASIRCASVGFVPTVEYKASFVGNIGVKDNG